MRLRCCRKCRALLRPLADIARSLAAAPTDAKAAALQTHPGDDIESLHARNAFVVGWLGGAVEDAAHDLVCACQRKASS